MHSFLLYQYMYLMNCEPVWTTFVISTVSSNIIMSSSKSILLRFESKDGQFRLSVNPTDQFTSLLSRVSPCTHQVNPAAKGYLRWFVCNRSWTTSRKMWTHVLSLYRTSLLEARIDFWPLWKVWPLIESVFGICCCPYIPLYRPNNQYADMEISYISSIVKSHL